MIGLHKYLCPLTVVYPSAENPNDNKLCVVLDSGLFFLVARTVTGGLFAFLDSTLILISVFLVLNLTKKSEQIFRGSFCSLLLRSLLCASRY